MAINGVTVKSVISIEDLISRLQKIHETIQSSFDKSSPFHTFIKSYDGANGVRLFSNHLITGLSKIYNNYDPLDPNTEFNQAITFLDSDSNILARLFNKRTFAFIKNLFSFNIILLENLDRSYKSYLKEEADDEASKHSLSSPSAIIAPLYAQQHSQKQPDNFVVNNDYLYSLFTPEKTFFSLNEQEREHFIEALVYLRKSNSPHLVALIERQKNEDLDCFLEFITPKLHMLSPEHCYAEIAGIAKTAVTMRSFLDPDTIDSNCKSNQEYGLSYFGSQIASIIKHGV